MAGALAGRTLFVTGASRGIGLAIARRAAADGANVAIAAKSVVPNPKLPGTIHTAVAEVDALGGRGLALRCDIREEEQVRAAVEEAVATFGGIDILVNNASAIWLRGTLDTPMKRYDLMQEVNARGTFLCSQACLPHLLKSSNPHILDAGAAAQPRPEVVGAAHRLHARQDGHELRDDRARRRVRAAGRGGECPLAAHDHRHRCAQHDPGHRHRTMPQARHRRRCGARDPRAPAAGLHGRFFIDEDALREAGITDFARYAVDPSQTPLPDLFL
jgi:citronellol/citronellal dehydrogenase